MSPPPFNGIRFCQGAFNYFGATVDFGGAAPELFPGVFLDAINFQLGLDPTVLIGGATLSAADITTGAGRPAGRLRLARGSPTRSHPAQPDRHCRIWWAGRLPAPRSRSAAPSQ